MSAKSKTSRIVLRLDSVGAPLPALRAIARLAQVLEAEFAARFVDDRRLVDALAFDARARESGDHATRLRHLERSLRREIEGIAVEAKMTWSFDIAQCAGIFATECALHADDLLAIALPDVEHMMGTLRQEISGGLSRASGVLLMTRTQPTANRPVVGMVIDQAGLPQVVETSAELAGLLHHPLTFVVADHGDLKAHVRKAAAAHWTGPGAVALSTVPTVQLDLLAAHVRNLRPKLVVIAASPSSMEEFLARPRLFREIGAPILFLPTTATG
jgi:hypothetical protein